MSGKPFVVTFTLANAMVEPKGPMALDALLSWASVRRAECAGHPQPFSVEHDLPLERHSVGDAWCFKASNLSFDWVGDRSRTVYTKRQQADDYIEAVMKGAMSEFMDGQFDNQRGYYKAGLFVEPLRFVEKAQAWGVGDIEEVKALLRWIESLGKLRRHGRGRIAEVTVEEDARALDKWANRTLPVGSPHASEGSHARAIGALVSPYWKREKFGEVLMKLEQPSSSLV